MSLEASSLSASPPPSQPALLTPLLEALQKKALPQEKAIAFFFDGLSLYGANAVSASKWAQEFVKWERKETDALEKISNCKALIFQAQIHLEELEQVRAQAALNLAHNPRQASLQSSIDEIEAEISRFQNTLETQTLLLASWTSWKITCSMKADHALDLFQDYCGVTIEPDELDLVVEILLHLW